MIGQLRTYTINMGMMESWLKLFRDELAPNLKKAGMSVHTAWVNDEGTKFIWVRTVGDRSEMEPKQAAFWASDWFKEHETRVRSHIAHSEVVVLEPFLPDGV